MAQPSGTIRVSEQFSNSIREAFGIGAEQGTSARLLSIPRGGVVAALYCGQGRWAGLTDLLWVI